MSNHRSPSIQSLAGWRYRGQTRPPFAIAPGPGQESVWDYPRPPRLEPDRREIRVEADGIEIARTRGAIRALETASPPSFYLPPQDCLTEHLESAAGRSWCEWKGEARYGSIRLPCGPLERALWSYPEPLAGFVAIRGYLAFYPEAGNGRLACFVDGVRVIPQPGSFYGGWITPELVGPFKGGPGSEGW